MTPGDPSWELSFTSEEALHTRPSSYLPPARVLLIGNIFSAFPSKSCNCPPIYLSSSNIFPNLNLIGLITKFPTRAQCNSMQLIILKDRRVLSRVGRSATVTGGRARWRAPHTHTHCSFFFCLGVRGNNTFVMTDWPNSPAARIISSFFALPGLTSLTHFVVRMTFTAREVWKGTQTHPIPHPAHSSLV